MWIVTEAPDIPTTPIAFAIIHLRVMLDHIRYRYIDRSFTYECNGKHSRRHIPACFLVKANVLSNLTFKSYKWTY